MKARISCFTQLLGLRQETFCIVLPISSRQKPWVRDAAAHESFPEVSQVWEFFSCTAENQQCHIDNQKGRNSVPLLWELPFFATKCGSKDLPRSTFFCPAFLTRLEQVCTITKQTKFSAGHTCTPHRSRAGSNQQHCRLELPLQSPGQCAICRERRIRIQWSQLLLHQISSECKTSISELVSPSVTWLESRHACALGLWLQVCWFKSVLGFIQSNSSHNHIASRNVRLR